MATKRDKNRERCSKYRSENPEKVREYGRKYRSENRNQERRRHRKYRAENPEHVREYEHRRLGWYDDDPELEHILEEAGQEAIAEVIAPPG